MSQPIYKMFMFRPTQAYYEASEEQRNEMLGKVNAAFEKAGGKRLALCSTYWASEQWQIFGLEVFPDIEAVQIYAQALEQIQMPRYLESVSMLGTEMTMT